MTRDEKIKELLSEVREALYYPHDDSCCDCKNCKMVDKIDALLQDEQPEPATEYGICLCCGEHFSKNEDVYVGTIHTQCWHRNKKQPCKTHHLPKECPEGGEHHWNSRCKKCGLSISYSQPCKRCNGSGEVPKWDGKGRRKWRLGSKPCPDCCKGEIKCNNCGKVLPELPPKAKRCPEGYLCRKCFGLQPCKGAKGD